MTVSETPTDMLSIYTPETTLDPWPFKPEQVVDGPPEASGVVLWHSDDKRVGCGIWECTPGTFEWEYSWDEMIYALEGEARIVDSSGNAFELRAGSLLYIPSGVSATWTVTQKVRKVFHFKSDDAPVEF